MSDAQKELNNTEVKGVAGGGLVVVTMLGDGKAKSVQIDNEALKDGDKDMLEDLIVAAINAAKEEFDSVSKQKMSNIGIPPHLMNMLGGMM